MVGINHNMKKMKTELPFSLISAEILSRLPAKSDIGRCRCVCKEWKSFLSTPMFNRTHFKSNVTINDYKLLLFHGQPPALFRTIAFNEPMPCNLNPYPDMHIIATLDGLICLASKEIPARLVFWNPFTGAYRKLPFMPCKFKVSAKDPIGFYFDDSCHDYKLVCLVNRGVRGAHVYSHRLDSWREIQFPFVADDLAIWSMATFCGQCVYFIVSGAESHSFSRIMSFDVKTESFREIQFPDVLRDATDYSATATLVVLNGCLHLCECYVSTKHANLWRMDDGTDEWVNVAAFSGQQLQCICTASVGSWLAVLDQNDNSFKKMHTDDFKKHYRYFCSAVKEYTARRIIYVETLVSPNP